MTRSTRPVVTADGTGIVSHAGAALLRELADQTGLTQGWPAALIDTYKGRRCTCRAGCSPNLRSPSPTAGTASLTSPGCGTRQLCSVRSPRTRGPTGCWTGSGLPSSSCSGLPVPMLVLGCGSLAADLTSPIPLG